MEDKKEVLEHKKKKVWPLVLMLIIGLALGIGGSYVYFEVIDKNQNKNSLTEKEKETVKNNTANDKDNDEVEISVDSVYINELVNQYDSYMISNIELVDTLYKNDKTNISSLDSSYLRELVIKRANNSLGNLYISGERFQNTVKLLFGNQVTLPNEDFQVNGCISYQYQNDHYSIKPTEGGCGGTTSWYMKRDIIKAIKKSDKLEITIAYAVLDWAENKVYMDIDNNRNLVNEITDVSIDNIDIRANASKLHQFKYVFEYDKTNDGYYLNYIEKVK